MKEWEYSLTTSVIWASFDNGVVKANSKEEAKTKALAQLTYDLNKVNDALKHCDVTSNFNVDMNFDCLEIKEIN